jgi:predicted DsbA family dithiol-disulfide isomerase
VKSMPTNSARPRVPDSRTVLHWFDFLCPFCYVGQQRNQILERRGLDIVHLPFQIHPDIPPGGVEVGPREGPMYEVLEREAAQAGLPLRWPARLPDTRMALAAAEWVRLHQPDVSEEFNRGLFAAHFALGEDLGDWAVIEGHAGRSGVDTEALNTAIADGSAFAALAEAGAMGTEFGVRATPSWFIAGELVSGLLPVAEFERLADNAIRRA